MGRSREMSISIAILTRDEAENLPECLDSVGFSDDVVVVDSHSTDETVPVAQARGARVFQRQFDDFAGQRNYALDEIAFEHPWVFFLDADERFTPELESECLETVSRDLHSGYLVPSKLMFMGRWLRWAGNYPVYQTRLVKIGEIRFVQAGHAQREGAAERGIGTLEAPYLHFNFSKGLDAWFEKHNRYSTQEAAEALEALEAKRLDWGALISRDAVVRRRALRAVGWRLPCRPALRFIYMYVLRLGFLDGRPGFTYCRLVALFEAMISIKLAEMRRARSSADAGRA